MTVVARHFKELASASTTDACQANVTNPMASIQKVASNPGSMNAKHLKVNIARKGVETRDYLALKSKEVWQRKTGILPGGRNMDKKSL